ncbi:hypothetical protein ACMD2_27324, partial [Ananas comosus]
SSQKAATTFSTTVFTFGTFFSVWEEWTQTMPAQQMLEASGPKVRKSPSNL